MAMEEKRHTRVQLLLQCDIASTSQINSWEPPLTSTPLISNHNQIRKPASSYSKFDPNQIRKQACSYSKFDQVQRLTARPLNHMKASQQFSIPSIHLVGSPQISQKSSSISSRSSQLMKSKNIFQSSDSSSDEEDFPTGNNKKLVIKINADKSRKAVDEKLVSGNGIVSDDNCEVKKKKGLKLNHVNSNKAKISQGMQDEAKKSTRGRKQSIEDVKNVSAHDKENVVKKIDCKKSRLPVMKKTAKVLPTIVLSSEETKKRKRGKSVSKIAKKMKVVESKGEEVHSVVNEDKELPELENQKIQEEPAVAEISEILEMEEKGEEVVAKISGTSKLGEELEEPVAENSEVLRTEEKAEVLEKTRNSSQHQLFSEIKEQEFLESLDLSAVEMEEEPGKLGNRSAVKKRFKKRLPQTTKTKKNNCSVLSDRPARNRKPPKEFWLPPSDDDKLKTEAKGTVIDDSEKNQDLVSASSRIAQCDKENEVSSSSSHAKRDLSEEFEPRYFIELAELDFRKNPVGYESAECSSLPKFKAGVLKIQSGAQAASKTKRKNSALGGIVIKGCAKMKVGNKEKHIKEGSVIFVPPLTDWVIDNTSDEETVMYYWCGQF